MADNSIFAPNFIFFGQLHVWYLFAFVIASN